MEFSLVLNSHLQGFINEPDASFLLVFICCFGILIFAVIMEILLKPFRKFVRLCYLITLPVWLTWVLGTVATGMLTWLDVEVIKTLSVIAALYILMLIYCILNINLITKYFSQIGKES